jgi:HEAT repeat protein
MVAMFFGAIWAIAEYGPRLFGDDETNKGELVGQLDDSEAGWRAAESLAGEGDEAVQRLRIALDNEDQGYGAARALGLMGRRGVPTLMGALLMRHNIPLQRRAASGLVWAGDAGRSDWRLMWRNRTSEELGRVRDAFEDGVDIRLPTRTSAEFEREGWERDVAVRAWCVANAAYEGMQRANPEPRVSAAIVIRECSLLASKHTGNLPQFARLPEFLLDKEQRVRVEVIRALSNLGKLAAPAAEQIAKALREDDSTWVQALAATALGRIGVASEPVVDALEAALEHPDLGVRAHAAQALGMLHVGDEEVVEQLLVLMREGGEERLASVVALGRIGKAASEALPDLFEYVADPSSPAALRLASAEAALSMGGNPEPLRPVLVEIAREGSRFADRDEAKRLLALTTAG